MVRVVVRVRANPNLTLTSPGVAVGTMAVATAVGTPAIAVGTPANTLLTPANSAMGVELRPPPLPHVASAARATNFVPSAAARVP